MAQKRMLDKKISVSEQVNQLSDAAALAFTWGITHADDFGFLPLPITTLKALIVPMRQYTDEYFFMIWREIAFSKDVNGESLIELIQFHGIKFWRYPSFAKTQWFKSDRTPQTILPFRSKSKTRETLEAEIEENAKRLEPDKDQSWFRFDFSKGKEDGNQIGNQVVTKLATLYKNSIDKSSIDKLSIDYAGNEFPQNQGKPTEKKAKKRKAYTSEDFNAAKDHLMRNWKLKSGEYPFSKIDAGILARLLTRGLPMTLALLDLFWAKIQTEDEKWTRDTMGKTLKGLIHILPKLLDDHKLKPMAEKYALAAGTGPHLTLNLKNIPLSGQTI